MILFFSKMPAKTFGADCRNSDLVRQSVAAPDLIIWGGGGEIGGETNFLGGKKCFSRKML